MRKQNQQRRAARKKRRRRQASGGSGPRQREPGAGNGQAGPAPTLDELLDAAVWSWSSEPDAHEALLGALTERADALLGPMEERLRDAVAGLWDRGWTPADLLHAVSRRFSARHAAAAAEVVVADGRERAERGQALHPRWEAQLGLLAERSDGGQVAPPALRLRLALELLCLLVRLPELPPTVPPPGTAVAVHVAAVGLDERVLARVRALLAKAESTEFDEEAEALTAKAQELIARHAIDEAVLHAGEEVGEPSLRRIPVDDPYADAKAALLTEVAVANRCQSVHTTDLGWVTIFGYGHDLDAVELLAASLLAQATSAMARYGCQRLLETTDGLVAVATDRERGRLLPVLAARDDRVRAAVEAVFPRLTSRSSGVSNAAGWAAGRAAADLADLGVSAGALRT